LKLRLREGLAHDLVGYWLRPGCALQLSQEGPIGINPDQRMHEDARHLSELSGDLGVQLLQSAILLITFVEVLWKISGNFSLTVGGHAYLIHGYMVWGAVFYAGFGSLLSYWVGRDLVARNAERYQRESEIRFALMRTNEHADDIAKSPEALRQARVQIFTSLDGVLGALWRLVLGVTNLTWVTAGYGWLTLVIPILIAAPAYFSGSLTFGGLMMAVGAFNQVQQSLRWFVDNFSSIADWRATLLRVAEFRRAIAKCDGAIKGAVAT
jgi:putative ATP-binding cassette transporter